MAARWLAAGVWAAVAASSVFWGLRLTAQGPGIPSHARWVDTERVARGDVTRLFATSAPVAGAVAAPSRFRLLGVLADVSGGQTGVALLATDDKPARAYRIGAVVEGETVVKSVSTRRVELGPRQGAATSVLELPVPAPAARGLPGAANSTVSSQGAVAPLQIAAPPPAMAVSPQAVSPQGGAPSDGGQPSPPNVAVDR